MAEQLLSRPRFRGKGGPLLIIGAVVGGSYAVVRRTLRAQAEGETRQELKKQHIEARIPTREEQVNKLQYNNKYDVLVIGGGATGAGIALVCLVFFL